MTGRINNGAELVKLDVKDMKILASLARNSREPLSSIAKKVMLSRDAVRYRINRLQKLGVIIRFTAIVDLKKFNYHNYHVLLHLTELDEEQENALYAYFEHQPNIMSVMEYSDEWDLEVIIAARGVQEYDSVLTDMMCKFPKLIEEAETLDTVKEYYETFLPKELLERKADVPKKQVEKIDIDKNDLKIIDELCKDSRLTLFELGTKVKLSADAVSYRIKKLLRQSIITEFTIAVNYSLLRYSMYTLVFRFNSFQPETETKLRHMITNHPLIQSGAKVIGRWNIILKVLAKTPDEFHTCLKEFRRAFKQEIEFYDTLLAQQEHYFEVFAPKLIKNG